MGGPFASFCCCPLCMHGYDVHKALYQNCEINTPGSGVQTLGGPILSVVRIQLNFRAFGLLPY